MPSDHLNRWISHTASLTIVAHVVRSPELPLGAPSTRWISVSRAQSFSFTSSRGKEKRCWHSAYACHSMSEIGHTAFTQLGCCSYGRGFHRLFVYRSVQFVLSLARAMSMSVPCAAVSNASDRVCATANHNQTTITISRVQSFVYYYWYCRPCGLLDGRWRSPKSTIHIVQGIANAPTDRLKFRSILLLFPFKWDGRRCVIERRLSLPVRGRTNLPIIIWTFLDFPKTKTYCFIVQLSGTIIVCRKSLIKK